MNDNDIIAQLHAVAANAGTDARHAAYLLRKAAREYGRQGPIEPSPLSGVPVELLMPVINGELDEEIARERGKRAAAAKSPEERDAILFAQDNREAQP